ncbi:MAG: hypothetical protein B6U76_10375 [Desulfurococcales archaeon ex4484_217_2]|nr:MAG: hypothetical protein B6U76_10375 [Desulfurococcales archaeon ex4484_217_2]
MFLEDMERLIYIYGPIGIFLVSFLGNVIPYSTVPYLIFIVHYGATVTETLGMIEIAILGGIGAALGKVIVLLIGSATRKILPETDKKSMKLFMKLAGKSVFIAVLVFAATPLPDDVLYIPLGAMGYSPFKFFVAAAIGKAIITYMALLFGETIRYLVGESSTIASIVAIVATLILMFLIVKVDWEMIIEEIVSKGWRSFILNLLKNPLKYVKKSSE